MKGVKYSPIFFVGIKCIDLKVDKSFFLIYLSIEELHCQYKI